MGVSGADSVPCPAGNTHGSLKQVLDTLTCEPQVQAWPSILLPSVAHHQLRSPTFTGRKDSQGRIEINFSSAVCWGGGCHIRPLPQVESQPLTPSPEACVHLTDGTGCTLD